MSIAAYLPSTPVFSRLLIVFGLIPFFVVQTHATPLDVSIVSKTGDLAPDGIQTFGSFNLVALSSTSDVLFKGFSTSVSQDGTGLYRAILGNQGQVINSLYLNGDLAPGVVNSPDQGLFDAVPNGAFAINRSDFFAFNARTQVVAEQHSTVFSQSGFAAQANLLTNFEGLDFGTDNGSITVPDLNTGQDLGGFFGGSISQLGVTADNRVVLTTVFGDGVPGGGGGQVTPIELGLFVGTRLDDWQNIFTNHDQAPGFAQGVTMSVAGFSLPKTGTGINLTSNLETAGLANGTRAFWRFVNGNLNFLASSDEPAPGFANSDWMPDDPVSGFDDRVLIPGTATDVASGQVVQAFWLEDANGDLIPVLEATQDGSILTQTSEGSIGFRSFTSPAVGPNHEIVFFGEGVAADGSLIRGLWQRSGTGDAVTLLVAQNTEAPGQTTDQALSPGALFFQDFVVRDINAQGQVLFSSTLFRNSFTTGSLWVVGTDSSLNFVAKEGDVFDGVTLDQFFFNRIGSATNNLDFNDLGTVAFLGFTPDGSDAGSSRDEAVFRALFSSPAMQEVLNYLWNGACGDSNWHSACADSNWVDNDTGSAAQKSPGDAGGTETAAIENADVVISDRSVALKSIQATGSLTVNQPLSVKENSAIENLTLNARLTADGTVILSGPMNVWKGGDIEGISGVGVASGAVLTIDPTSGRAILKTGLGISGTAVQRKGLELTDGNGISGGVTVESGGLYDIQQGDISDSSSGAGEFVNRGTLKKTTDSASRIETPFTNAAGATIDVQQGSLIIAADTILKGGSATVAGKANLVFSGGPGSNAFTTNITGNITASGDGTLSLSDQLKLDIADGVTAAFNLSGSDGEGLLIDSATLTGKGTLVNSDTGRMLIRKATADALQGGLVNEGTLVLDDGMDALDPVLTLKQTSLINNATAILDNAAILADISDSIALDTEIINSGIFTLISDTETPDTAIQRANDTVALTFRNKASGKLEKEGAGDARIEGTVINEGTINVREGKLTLSDDVTFAPASGVGTSVLLGDGGGAKATLELGSRVVGQSDPVTIVGDVSIETLVGNTLPAQRVVINSGLSFKSTDDGLNITSKFASSGESILPVLEVLWAGGDFGAASTGGRLASLLQLSGALLDIGDSGDATPTTRVLTSVALKTSDATINQNSNLQLNNSELELQDTVYSLEGVNVGIQSPILSTIILGQGSRLVATDGTEHRIDPLIAFKISSPGQVVLDNHTVLSLTDLGTKVLGPPILQDGKLENGNFAVGEGSRLFLGPMGANPEIHSLGANARLTLTGNGIEIFEEDGGGGRAIAVGKLNNLPDAFGDFTNEGALNLNTITFRVIGGGFLNQPSALLHLFDARVSIKGVGNRFVNNGNLTGNGSIGAQTVNNGTLSPGSSPGRITIEGDYTQGASGVLSIELAGTAADQFDQLIVEGLASFDPGARINIQLLDPDPDDGIDELFIPRTGDTFDFLVADTVDLEGQTLADLIDFVNLPQGLSFDSLLSNVNGQTLLRLSAIFGSSLTELTGLSPAQAAVASALDAASIGTGSKSILDFALGIDGLASDEAKRAGLAQTSLSLGSSLFDLSNTALAAGADQLARHLDNLIWHEWPADASVRSSQTGGRSVSSGFWGTTGGRGYSIQNISDLLSLAGDQLASSRGGEKTFGATQGWRAFVAGSYEFGDFSGSTNQIGSDYDGGGATFGIEYVGSDQDWLVGAAASINRLRGDLNARRGSTDVEARAVSLYGLIRLADHAVFDGRFSLGRVNDSYQRQIAIPGQAFAAGANPDGDYLGVGGRFSLPFHISRANVGPVVEINYTKLDMDGFRETAGSDARLIIDQNESDTLSVGLGVRGSGHLNTPWGRINPRVSLLYQRGLLNNSPLLSGQFAGALENPFHIRTDDRDEDGLNLGLGLVLQRENFLLSLDYQGYLLNDDSTQHGLVGNVSWHF